MRSSDLRRMMMAQKHGRSPGDGIVTEGLGFHLDGKDRGGVEGKWRDLISGMEFNLVNCQENERSVFFNGSSWGEYVSTDYPFYKFPADQCTIEMVIRPKALKGMILTPNFDVHTNFPVFAIGIDGPSLWYSYRMLPGYAHEMTPGENCTVSISQVFGFTNRKKLQNIGADRWGGLHGYSSYIGRRSSGTYFAGEIYAIRIYDRQLTEAEILQNQQYDIDTYFGGVIPK